MKRYYGNQAISSVKERNQLINFIKINALKGVKVKDKDEIFNHHFSKTPANNYYYVYYKYTDLAPQPVYCIIYCRSYNRYTNYFVPLDEHCLVTDEMLNWCNNSVLINAKKQLNEGLSAIEKQFGKRITQSKQESRNNGVDTSKQVLLYKNLDFDGLEIEHVTGVDATSAYSSYVVEYTLNWCTIPDELYETEELKEQINAAANKFFKDYMLKWFERKKAAETPEQKRNAKAMLNVIIGMLRNCNVWVWKQIVGGVKDKMLDLKRKVEANGTAKVIYANTDSIYYTGTTDVFDPLFGTELGNFHIEHRNCRFRWGKGVIAYQIDDELPVYRGIPKQRFKQFELDNHRAFNLLTDEVPPVNYIGEPFQEEIIYGNS